jgi:hypothetical protein
MKDDLPLPPELKRLDRTLRAVRFGPRASLGAEIEGRLRRGEEAGRSRPERVWWRKGVLAAGVALCALAAGVWWYLDERPGLLVVDHCCYDLDGGGKADDGLHIVAGQGERVRRVAIYEDLDGSVSFTRQDLVRYRSP